MVKEVSVRACSCFDLFGMTRVYLVFSIPDGPQAGIGKPIEIQKIEKITTKSGYLDSLMVYHSILVIGRLDELVQ